MHFYLVVLLAFSIFLPALLAVYRFESIRPAYYPFVIMVWIASINELTSFLLLMNRIPNFINNNLYGLIETMLIVFLFKNLKVINDRRLLYAIIFLMVSVWAIENLVFQQVHRIGMYFRTISSLVIVLLSISMLNIAITDARLNVFKNPDFLMCISFIIYFTFRIMIEMFWQYGLNTSSRFQLLVYDLLTYVNLFCNLIFMLAVLWMPRKQLFTMR